MLVFFVPGNTSFFLLPLVGVVLQGSSSITYGTVGNFVHDQRQSRGFATIYTIANAASVTGPVLFGLVGDSLGIKVTMTVMAVLTLVPLPLCFPLRSALRRNEMPSGRKPA